MEFLDETLSKITTLNKVIPLIFLSLTIWLVFLTIVITLLYFNIIDIKSIVEGMKQCIVSLSIF